VYNQTCYSAHDVVFPHTYIRFCFVFLHKNMHLVYMYHLTPSLSPGKMFPSFEKAAFALKVGEMSGIVESDSGLHVILRTA
jgi:hypothetical protein